MPTYDEIIAFSEANKNTLGMSPSEIEKRQQLIRNVAQHSPDLALDMAKGPYRENLGSTATPQEAWRHGPDTPAGGAPTQTQGGYAPVGSQQYPAGQIPQGARPPMPSMSDQVRSNPPTPPQNTMGFNWNGQTPPMNPPTTIPSQTGPIVPGQQTTYIPTQGQYAGSPPIPQTMPVAPGPVHYGQPQGQQPSISVNITPPQQYQDFWQNPSQQMFLNSAAQIPPNGQYYNTQPYWDEVVAQQLGTAFGPRPRSYQNPVLSQSWQQGDPNFAGNAMWQGARATGMPPLQNQPSYAYPGQEPRPRPVNIVNMDGTTGTYNQQSNSWQYNPNSGVGPRLSR